MFNFLKKRVYLDYAAATPTRSEVVRAMKPYWSGSFANPSAIHREGTTARDAIEGAREKVARTLRVRAHDVIFTSGGTEGNNLALKGAVAAMRDGGVATEEIEIISLATEHPSILVSLEELSKEGCKVIYAPIDEDGLLLIEEFKKLLSPRTRLVTIAYANSETGVVQDIGRIARAIKAFEKESGIMVLFHTDACQAPLWLPCALDSLGVDMMTLDAGKCEGPKGVGILVARARVKLGAVSAGGAQERSLRPGTEPVPLIVGAATALALAQAGYETRTAAVSSLRDRAIEDLLKLEGVIINGSKQERLANNINISIPGFDSEFAVVVLDANGVAASTKSACAGKGSGRSHVVFAMTKDEVRARSTLRFTLGPATNAKDLKRVVGLLATHLKKLRDFPL